jgi:hydrophobic/amphiphilic exporter-1 (mainly G- bacteria), HAE1 family
MGSAYINDFDFNNRSYRVYVQADKQFRSHPQDIGQYYVRSDSGAMIPLENLVTITQSAAPQVINHYNLFRSAEIDGSAAPGFSSGQAIDAMQQLSAKTCRRATPTNGREFRSKNWPQDRPRSSSSASERWSSI